MTTAAPHRRLAQSSRLAIVLLAAYALIPAVLVLGPLPLHLFQATVNATDDVSRALFGPTAQISRRDIEAVCNVLVFLPIGFLLVPAVPRAARWRLVLACACASGAIEVVQWLALSGRYATLADVVHNTLGATLGVVAAQWLDAVRDRRWSRLGSAASGAAGGAAPRA